MNLFVTRPLSKNLDPNRAVAITITAATIAIWCAVHLVPQTEPHSSTLFGLPVLPGYLPYALELNRTYQTLPMLVILIALNCATWRIAARAANSSKPVPPELLGAYAGAALAAALAYALLPHNHMVMNTFLLITTGSVFIPIMPIAVARHAHQQGQP